MIHALGLEMVRLYWTQVLELEEELVQLLGEQVELIRPQVLVAVEELVRALEPVQVDQKPLWCLLALDDDSFKALDHEEFIAQVLAHFILLQFPY